MSSKRVEPSPKGPRRHRNNARGALWSPHPSQRPGDAALLGRMKSLKSSLNPPCMGQGGQHPQSEKRGDLPGALLASQRSCVPPDPRGFYLLQLGSGGGDR